MFERQPYDLEGHIRHFGNGINMYRGEDFGQPLALHEGDVLSNGWTVIGKPHEGFNGGIVLRFSTGRERTVPGRIPLQLKSDQEGILPADLQIGHILQTGCVVLDHPRELGMLGWHGTQNEVGVKLTGGLDGAEIGLPSDLAIAVFDEVYPPNTDTMLGAYAVEGVLAMRDSARRNLPQLG